MKKYLAEFIGTFVLVLGGCGTALYACNFPVAGVGFLGVALAFGLTVLTMAYAVGHISGAHFNPAVSIGLCVGGRFDKKELLPYIVAQVIGAIAASGILYLIVSGQDGFHGIDNTQAGAFTTNGFGAFSPNHFSALSCFIAEAVLTAVFLIIIMGVTSKKAAAGFAPLAIGLGLTLIHLISIPITNTSVNPARSTGVALFAGGAPLGQLWFFWLAPIVGAMLGALIYRAMECESCEKK